MQHLDEGTIHAWLDGELPLETREEVEAHVASCDECKASVAEARGFIAAASRILTALDAVPGGVLPASATSASSTKRAPARFTISRAWMAAAALLVLSTATVIAVRPRRDAASLQVAAAPRQEQPAVLAPSIVAPPAEKVASPAPLPAPAPAVARAPEPRTAGALAEASERLEDKASAGMARVRKDAAPPAVAAADRPAPAPPEASSARATDAKEMRRDSSSSNRYALRAPTAHADSVAAQRPLQLQQVIVSGAGTSSASKKLGSTIASPATPLLVSRHSESDGADSIVTTVYTVGGAPVTLVDRSSARDEVKRDTSMGFTDQVAAKSRAAAPLNSITWSDSSGRTRTLRGAVSQAELERVKSILFGATP